MPEVMKFLSGFGLIQGREYENYTLTKINVVHKIIKRYQEYKYLITLTFQPKSKPAFINNLFRAVEEELSQPRIIYGVKNPYVCSVNITRVTETEKSVVISATGYAFRTN